jgi:hypothetical protein
MENEEPFAKQKDQSASTTSKDDAPLQQVLCFGSSALLPSSVLSLPFSLASSKIHSFMSPNWKWGLLFTNM